MASRKQDLIMQWEIAHVQSCERRCELIEKIITRELKTGKATIAYLKKWGANYDKTGSIVLSDRA